MLCATTPISLTRGNAGPTDAVMYTFKSFPFPPREERVIGRRSALMQVVGSKSLPPGQCRRGGLLQLEPRILFSLHVREWIGVHYS